MSALHLLVTSLEGDERNFHAKKGNEMMWAVGAFGELEVWQRDSELDPVPGSMIVFNSLDWSTCEEQEMPVLQSIDCGVVSSKNAL